MRFFLDNCLPIRLARALNTLDDDNEVEHLQSLFRPNTEDDVWIPRLAEERDWVIISGDVRITRKPHLREAWHRSRLTAFFLQKGWMTAKLWDQCWMLIRWWPSIIDQARLVKPGTGFLVPFKSTGKFQSITGP